MRDERRVIFVNRYFFPDESATSQILTDIAERLAQRGFRVVVITSRLLYGGSTRILAAGDKFNGVEIHRIWTTSFGRSGRGRLLDYLTFYATSAWTVFRIARCGDIVVAKTDPPMLSITLLASTKFRRASLVNWLQDLFPEVLEAVSNRKIPHVVIGMLRRLRNISLKASRENVAIGQTMKSVLIDQGIPRARISVIPNWADGELIRPELRHFNQLRRDWGLDDDAFVVAYSGNLGRVHELNVVIDAARRTLSDKRVVFVLIGAGFQRKRLEALVAEWRLTNVIFKDPVPRSQLGLVLTLPNVHIVSLKPSLEGYVVPSKIYGVMAAGVPTVFIGTEQGEVGRLVLEEPRCGAVIRPEDGEGLASTLLDLAREPRLCAELGRSARAKFASTYDVSVAAEKWYGLLQQVANSA
jgi:glycosyltransferase involved in cell wall biosynthesis